MYMYVLIACKFKKYLINCNQEKVEKQNKTEALGKNGVQNTLVLYPNLCICVPESIKRIRLKTTRKRWKNLFPHYKSMGVFF